MAEIYTFEPPQGRMAFDDAREHASWRQHMHAMSEANLAREAAAEQRQARADAELEAWLDTAAGDAAFRRRAQAMKPGRIAARAPVGTGPLIFAAGALCGVCIAIVARVLAALP